MLTASPTRSFAEKEAVIGAVKPIRSPAKAARLSILMAIDYYGGRKRSCPFLQSGLHKETAAATLFCSAVSEAGRRGDEGWPDARVE
jgi:hypothetical protein